MQPAPTNASAILEDPAVVHFTGGLELVDLGLNVLEDISSDLAGGRIERNSYADLHAVATLRITRRLDWGADLVRPYVTVSANGLSMRCNLGVYHLSTPAYPLGEKPPTFEVNGYDMLLRLRQPVGDAYAIDVGESYLTRVEAILLARGYQKYLIDPTAAATVTPTARTWAFDEQITWLTIVNDLLSSIGYAGVWSDWDGRLRCEPYILPANRDVEWTYTDDAATTMLAGDGEVQHDFFESPNQWVIFRSNRTDETPPVEGAGIYTYVNQSVGLTSVDARGGLIVPRVQGLDAADQASLVVAAQQLIQNDMDVPTIIERPVYPNPLHWHFDRLIVQDSASIPIADAQCTGWSWALPPEEENMNLTLRVITQ
jgi:hypothetical protein